MINLLGLRDNLWQLRKTNTDKRQNSINMTNGNRKSNIRPSICTTEKYLQNHIHQQRIVPGNYSYSNATQHQKRKAVMISDWNWITN